MHISYVSGILIYAEFPPYVVSSDNSRSRERAPNAGNNVHAPSKF